MDSRFTNGGWGRGVRERALDTRAAREKLKVSGKPYYGPAPWLPQGQERPAVSGPRLCGGQYHVRNIGIADDIADADGVTVLDFWQAQEKARGIRGDSADVPARYTVRQAIADYVQEGRPAQKKT